MFERVADTLAWGVVLVLVVLVLATVAKAEDKGRWRLLEPRAVSLRGEQFTVLRDPYIRQYDDDWLYEAQVRTKFDIVSRQGGGLAWRLYYDPILKFRSTNSQIRQGGLEYETGLGFLTKSGRGIKFFHYHESLHCLECNADTVDGRSTSRHYPLHESYGIQLDWRLD